MSVLLGAVWKLLLILDGLGHLGLVEAVVDVTWLTFAESVGADYLVHVESLLSVAEDCPRTSMICVYAHKGTPRDGELPHLRHAWVVARNPFERLIMITTVLTTAGASGRVALKLADDIGYQGREDSRREQLARDIRSLKKVGLEISNVADEGEEGRWVLQPQDSRIRLAFERDERAELARAALLTQAGTRERLLEEVGPGEVGASADLADVPTVAVQYAKAPPELELLLHAVATRCLVTFRYSGSSRAVHPYRMQYGTSGWWLFGMEIDSGRTKTYTLSRMAQIGIADPGSADVPSITPHPGTDPLTWLVDKPIEAVLSCEPPHAEDVRTLLRAEMVDRENHAESWEGASGRATLKATVVNRGQFLARVIELGARVRLEAPDGLREELRSRLRELISA